MAFSNKRPTVDRTLKVLHIFDFYLPSTMNWAYHMMKNTPNVQQWVAAPWMVHNEYFDEAFRFFVRPFQQIKGFIPQDEWTAAGLSNNIIRLEKRWHLYKRWLGHEIQKDPPDLIHAHFAPVGYHYLDLAKRLNIPMLVSFYGYDYQRLPFEKPVYQARYQQLFQQANAITTTGPFTPKLLVEQGCPPDKIIPMPLGVAMDRFPFQVREKSAGQLKLVQVATITAKKGYLDTLEALRLALPKCPNIHLTIAGEIQDLALVKEMKAFIKINQLERQVKWLNFIAYESLAGFLGQFDVFIHPSCRTARRDSEGAPVVILQAQALGLPIIATSHADIPIEVLHGKSGFLSPENSPASLSKSIERFYGMENSEYQQFSQSARKHIELNFDIKQTGLKLRLLYMSMMSNE